MAGKKTIKSAIESMMFVWGEPLDIKEAAEVFNMDKKEIYPYFKELQEEYEQEGRGIVIREVNKCFQFVTRAENIDYIERLCTPVKHKKIIAVGAGSAGDRSVQTAGDKGETNRSAGSDATACWKAWARKNWWRKSADPMLSDADPVWDHDEFLKQFGFSTLKELPDIVDIEGALDEENGENDILYSQQISIDLSQAEPDRTDK